MENKKRIGFVLACAGMVAALLFEPINGRKRRDRIGHALEPAGRPLQAVRARLSGKASEGSGEGSGATLVERLHHVAIRAQGKIDVPAELMAHSGDGALHEETGAQAGEEPKPRKRRKKAGAKD